MLIPSLYLLTYLYTSLHFITPLYILVRPYLYLFIPFTPYLDLITPLYTSLHIFTPSLHIFTLFLQHFYTILNLLYTTLYLFTPLYTLFFYPIYAFCTPCLHPPYTLFIPSFHHQSCKLPNFYRKCNQQLNQELRNERVLLKRIIETWRCVKVVRIAAKCVNTTTSLLINK